MTTGSLRNRYLAALGISGSMLSACSSTEPGGTTPTTTADLTATATSQPTATVASAETSAPTATASEPTAAPTESVAFWQPTVFPPLPKLPVAVKPDDTRPRASCPSGEFCVAEADAGGEKMAAEPFAKCAVQAKDPQNPSSRSRSIHFDKEQTQRERTKTKDACCYDWVIPCPGGRPLMVGGAARLAEAARSQAWVGNGSPQALPALTLEQRSALADHYMIEAAYEHASVAAFARVSLALLAVGAPADLVADTHRAALDEIKHAEAMYTLASAYRGESIGPGPLSLEGTSLGASIVELASEAFIEGCVGEVAAALVLREEAARAVNESTRELLASLASDEERHAELAFRTVAWAFAQDPAGVRAALVVARGTLEAELAAELPPQGRRLPLVTSASERMAIRKLGVRDVVLPCVDALLAREKGGPLS